ncbi:MAG: glutamate--tRNA ligase [Rhodobacteraceae bacterium]|nr:glutamate--tRNA ligase [Paracoccaceae bacterium]
MTNIVTRFAPSPTGFLHIGGARTALFNWLLARSEGGRFLLRIEDTDRVRSNDKAARAIVDDLQWLGLDWDGEPVSQFERSARHVEVAERLLASGAAYRCFASADEIDSARQREGRRGKGWVFRSPWRDADDTKHPDEPFAVRLRVPRNGAATVSDAVYGSVKWRYSSIGDIVILRSDGTPTYNFAVVVDDHDMGISHVVRGDDHLANTAKQKVVYEAMDWQLPTFAHVPLIHGPDGRKLSKRHGAPGVGHYRKAGFLPEAIRNFLARLGWSHGDEEILSTARLLEVFSIDGIRKAPARLNKKKLANLSGRHMSVCGDAELLELLEDYAEFSGNRIPDGIPADRLLAALPVLKTRCKTLADIIDSLGFLNTTDPISYDSRALATLSQSPFRLLAAIEQSLTGIEWNREKLEASLTGTASRHEASFATVAKLLRAALVGKMSSPSVYDVMLLVGRSATLARLTDARKHVPKA